MLLTALVGEAGMAEPLAIDCEAANCPELVIQGDTPAEITKGKPSPFRGYADAVLRQDPTSASIIHMAYSWPFAILQREKGRRKARIGVESHYAVSTDGGRTFTFVGEIRGGTAAIDPKTGTKGEWSAETPNFLPLTISGKTIWIGAWLEYFLPDKGGYKARVPDSFRLAIVEADRPMGLKSATPLYLGTKYTGERFRDLDLASLSPETAGCTIWNEPALAFEAGTLYLALSCQVLRQGKPVMDRNTLVLFATQMGGPPKAWSWRYVGRLAGSTEARALGGERLTQVELAKTRDGRWLMIATPDVWDTAKNDEDHLGCVAVEIAALAEARLARDASGRPVERARIAPRSAGGTAGDTAACAYDPASATGILIGWRTKVGVTAQAEGGTPEFTVMQRVSGLRL